MVAQHTRTPGDPPRDFSAAIRQRLEAALARLNGDSDDLSSELRAALEAGGQDALAQQMHPEELVVAFKRIMEGMLGAEYADSSKRSALRLKMIRALLAAYYA
jgi:hypothetical protein